jgi:hypothetical protein
LLVWKYRKAWFSYKLPAFSSRPSEGTGFIREMESKEPSANIGFGSKLLYSFKQERAKWDSGTAFLFVKKERLVFFPQHLYAVGAMEMRKLETKRPRTFYSPPFSS